MSQRPKATVFGMLALVCASMTLAQPAAAQQPTQSSPPAKSPLGITLPSEAQRGLTAGRPPAITSPVPPPAAAASGPIGRAWVWIEEQRLYFNRAMSTAVRSLRTEPFGAALLSLLGICFAYGVLHAAGPGHGKGVISAYALANNETVKRGIILSFMSALFQALSAIVIFLVLTLIFSARKTDFDKVESWLESASWALIAGIGAWLLWSRVAAVMGWRSGAHSHGHVHGHGHAHGSQPHGHHHHDHGHAHGHAHDHKHAHTQACAPDCGHVHIPMPDQLQGAWSWRRAFGIAASVGIRPCTGALILLAFCSANALLWAGILGTLVMSLGTAIAISVLATLAVGSRQLATRLAGEGSHWGRRIGTAAGILGSALVLVMGSAFFIMSLRGPGPF